MCPAGLPYQRCQYLKNIQMILDACWDDYGFSVYLENVFSLYWFAEPSRFREYGYLSSDIDFFVPILIYLRIKTYKQFEKNIPRVVFNQFLYYPTNTAEVEGENPYTIVSAIVKESTNAVYKMKNKFSLQLKPKSLHIHLQVVR